MFDYRNKDMSLKEYLEALVELYHQKNRLKRFDEEIGICTGIDSIHLMGGIEGFAKIVDVPIHIDDLSDTKHLIFSFVYKGVKFLQVRTEEEWEEYKNVCMQ